MKVLYIIVFLILSFQLIKGQVPVKRDTIIPRKGHRERQLERIKERKIKLHSDLPGTNQPKQSKLIDTTKQDKYGNLLRDDPVYNKKFPLIEAAIGVPVSVTATWLADRFILKTAFTRISLKTWHNNLREEWSWNNDLFGVNFFGHPYLGTLSYNDSRSNGYNYYQSFTFAVSGSLIWEYFGQNTRPAYNDVINTSINGAFLGEILYRLSSNILDDRSTGAERIFREILAGILDPKRGFDRLIQGKTFRLTNKEVYQKEPLNISIYAGIHRINDQTKGIFSTATTTQITNIQLDYGNPFEVRSRQPFDFFKLRAELNLGVGNKYLDNVLGYGILFGQNIQIGKLALLIGGFQNYDYWNNQSFELGAIGFGGGLFSKLIIGKDAGHCIFTLYTNFNLAIVPFAGNSTGINLNSEESRDYNFGDGLEGKIESTLNIGTYGTFSILYYYFVINTYSGNPGNNLIGIFQPRITLHLYKNLSVGFEQYVYTDARYVHNYENIHLDKTEQRVFILLFLQDPQRKGHYN